MIQNLIANLTVNKYPMHIHIIKIFIRNSSGIQLHNIFIVVYYSFSQLILVILFLYYQNIIVFGYMGKSYAYGPIPNEQRTCTDAFCILIFIFFSLGIFSIAVYATLHKGVQNLTAPADSDGKLCGIELKQFPFIYFVSPHIQSFSQRVCVSQCPSSQQTKINCSLNSVVTSCQKFLLSGIETQIQIYPTQLFLNRICLPQPGRVRDQVLRALDIKIDQQKILQLQRNWRLIVLSIPMALLITTLLLLLVRYTACFSIYCITMLAVGILLFLVYYFYQQSLLTSPEVQFFHIKKNLLQKILAGVCLVLAIIIFVFFVCFRKRINIAIKIIKASARFVNHHGYLIIISFLKLIFMTIFIALWLVELWGLFTFKQLMWKSYKFNVSENADKAIKTGIMVLHVFYLLWGFFFINQSGSFIVSGTVTNWYFKQPNTCSSSVKRYASYHSGSVCAGSFYIALFGLIKLIYEWLRPTSQQQDSCMGKFQKCCDWFCCICVTYIFSVLNRGAYTFIHISGRPYCQSSLKVFSLKASQPIFSGVIMFLQIIFSLILRIQIIAITLGCSYLLIKYVQPFKYDNSDLTLTLIAIGVVGFVISQLFVSIYVEAADTVAICFIIDKQYGQGDNNCPQQLKEYLQETRANDGFIQ